MMSTEDRKGARAEPTVINEALPPEVERQIIEAFETFDHEHNRTVDVREIGTIIRSLGCCPTEAELLVTLTEMEDNEAPGYVRLDRFVPVMSSILLQQRFRPSPQSVLLQAFQKLDKEKKGYLTRAELIQALTQEGEPFTEEEMEEMLSAALNTDTGNVYYEDFVTHMAVEDL